MKTLRSRLSPDESEIVMLAMWPHLYSTVSYEKWAPMPMLPIATAHAVMRARNECEQTGCSEIFVFRIARGPSKYEYFVASAVYYDRSAIPRLVAYTANLQGPLSEEVLSWAALNLNERAEKSPQSRTVYTALGALAGVAVGLVGLFLTHNPYALLFTPFGWLTAAWLIHRQTELPWELNDTRVREMLTKYRQLYHPVVLPDLAS